MQCQCLETEDFRPDPVDARCFVPGRVRCRDDGRQKWTTAREMIPLASLQLGIISQ